MGFPPRTPPPQPLSREQLSMRRAQWQMQSRMRIAAQRRFIRKSLVGPLLLIAVGIAALLLTTHRVDAAYFWLWYGQWWPVILIGAGVILALESIAFSRYSRIRLGAGVVLVGIVLAFLGVAVSHRHIRWIAVGDQFHFGDDINLSQVFGAPYKTSEKIVHAIPANATLVIQNAYGNVSVTSDNGTAAEGEMDLLLNKTVYVHSKSKSQQEMQTLEPLITSTGNVVTVHMPSSKSRNADMDITLPAKISVQIHAENGDVKVNGRQAPVTIDLGHGNVQLDSIGGTVQVAMHQGNFSAGNVTGDLRLTGHMDNVRLSQIAGAAALDGDFFGKVSMETISGPLHLHSSRTDLQLAQLAGSMTMNGDNLTVQDATGPNALVTKAKNISFHRVTGPVRIQNSNGNITVTALNPIGTMSIENVNGSVQLSLPAASKFSVEASALGGEVRTDFNFTTKSEGDRSLISGSVGSGGPTIHITAKHGDVTLRKSQPSSG